MVGECRCDGGQPKNFLRPCLLLLLGEQAAHGYELIERLKAFGFSRDPGGLYRMLRSMEREGLVRSQWEPSGVGPDRCRYHLTPAGGDWLRAWAETLDDTRRTLEEYLQRYRAVAERTLLVKLMPEGIRYDDLQPLSLSDNATNADPTQAGQANDSSNRRN
ncbi:MAG TPA: helix-turn-helix transcriptional regulator [Candidatus Sulfotelmatobacter sp.]|nr:helix-turn-helix transcriptional regulator [Candidatus Sulfotelmatobacter sp.]